MTQFSNRPRIEVFWCMACQSEEAITTVDAEINEQWVQMYIGQSCLTRLEKQGRIDV
jgi:uncharacterized protein YlaI